MPAATLMVGQEHAGEAGISTRLPMQWVAPAVGAAHHSSRALKAVEHGIGLVCQRRVPEGGDEGCLTLAQEPKGVGGHGAKARRG